MPDKISFTVYCRPQPQGSMKAFSPKGWNRPVLTSTNKNLKSYRQEVSKVALVMRGDGGIVFGKHVPVELSATFYVEKPKSTPKKRLYPVVKPDCDKYLRAVFDSLTGIIFEDDSQVVVAYCEKRYGVPERTEITVREFNDELAEKEMSLGDKRALVNKVFEEEEV